MNKKYVFFLTFFVGTIIFLRLFLFFFPNVNLTISGVNIHHLYLGVLIFILLVPFLLVESKSSLIPVLLGLGSALTVDELTYLVATDGSDLAYFSSISWTGAVVLTLIILGITLFYFRRKIS